MTINKLKSVTIVICALNEERGIRKILDSVLSQKTEGFILKEILVISDGSTDNTVKIVKQLKSQKIKIEDHKERKGKAARLATVYKNNTSDILAQVDADAVLANKNVIKNLIQPLLDSPTIGMTGGNSQPLKPKTFVEKSVYSSFIPYSRLRKIKNSLSIGPMLAFKKLLAKQIEFPKNIIGEDVYSYFVCLVKGYKYVYVDSAVVYFRLPQSLKDQISQNTRFVASPIRMSKYFPANLVNEENRIPFIPLLKELLFEFVKHPIQSAFIFFVNQYCRLIAGSIEGKLNTTWEISNSTKK